MATKSKNNNITVFEKIHNILPQINGNKKRMLNINFIPISNQYRLQKNNQIQKNPLILSQPLEHYIKIN